MPSFCMVVNCGSKASSKRDQHLKFFRLPSMFTRGGKLSELGKKRRNMWIKALRREDLTSTKIKFGRICSKHFHSGNPAELQDTENPDWIPSKNMGYSTSNTPKTADRYMRLKKRTELTKSTVPDAAVSAVPQEEEVLEPSYDQLKMALAKAQEKIHKLNKQLASHMLEETFLKNNDDDVLYFTGFPTFTLLKAVFEEIEPFLTERSSTLSKFQQFVLTLIKLRLDFDFTYLGKKFSCHRTTASRIFEKVIDVLYNRFKNLVYWPTRDNLQINMPTAFKSTFGLKVTVIIDCFEVFIEKPSNLEAAAKTWSNYKHHQTMKFLIGISPQGFISFISKAYGGRASDKFVTEDCGFLDNLCPGDLVIADRGFAVDDSVRLYCAQVKYPTFLKGKKQLGPEDIENTRKLANVRIHVERVIRQLKGKYRIFNGTFPMAQLRKIDEQNAFVDKIIRVCCSFINLCPSIVPL